MNHLKKRSDFLKAAKGCKWVMPALVLQVRAREAGDDAGGAARIGFTASRRVGGAVQRNRAKRRLREAVRAVLENSARENFDYVIIARKAVLSRPFDAVLDDLKIAVTRLHKRARI